MYSAIYLSIIFFWVGIFIVVKLSPVLPGRSCSKCGKVMERIPRNSLDKFIESISFSKLGRFKCEACNWEGLKRRK